MTNSEKFLAGKKFTVKKDPFKDAFYFRSVKKPVDPVIGIIGHVYKCNTWPDDDELFSGSVRFVTRQSVTVTRTVVTTLASVKIKFSDLIFLDDDK